MSSLIMELLLLDQKALIGNKDYIYTKYYEMICLFMNNCIWTYDIADT